MGCHTYFNNKVSCIKNKDIEALRKFHIDGIKRAYIYNVSLDEWISDHNEEIEDYKKWGDSDEVMRLSEIATREYYEKHHKIYEDDLKKLQDSSTSKDELLKIFERHSITFNIKDDDYSLFDLGWVDKYRVSGYPSGSFHTAEEAISFLENYKDGTITCNGKKGMSDDVREIIREFFKQYPNGSIHYG